MNAMSCHVIDVIDDIDNMDCMDNIDNIDNIGNMDDIDNNDDFDDIEDVDDVDNLDDIDNRDDVDDEFSTNIQFCLFINNIRVRVLNLCPVCPNKMCFDCSSIANCSYPGFSHHGCINPVCRFV